jgi:DNA-binding transcriptional MerR regulator
MSAIAKSSHAFRTIAEAAEELDVPAHVLRFWEGKFTQLRPLKRAGGRRHYRPDDMALLRGIRALLQEDGYQLKGVQKLLRDQGISWVRERGVMSGPLDGDQIERLPEVARAPTFVGTPSPLASSPAKAAPSDTVFEAKVLVGNLDTISPAAGIILRQALVKLEKARAMLDRVRAISL